MRQHAVLGCEAIEQAVPLSAGARNDAITRDHTQARIETLTLAITPWFGRDELSFEEGATLLDAQTESRGFVRVTAMLDHRIEPGRQIILKREDGTFYGGSPTYRVEQVEHSGSVWQQEWYSVAILRPTNKPPLI